MDMDSFYGVTATLIKDITKKESKTDMGCSKLQILSIEGIGLMESVKAMEILSKTNNLFLEIGKIML